MPAQSNSKTFLITYSQCEFSQDELLRHLRARFGRANYIVVGQERHRDGGHHLHAFLQFPTPQRWRNAPEQFRWRDRRPNVQDRPPGGSSAENGRDYVKKDGNFCEDGNFRPSVRGNGKKNTRFTEIVEAHQETNSCLSALLTDQLLAWDTAKSFKNIQSAVTWIKQTKPVYTPEFEQEEFNVPLELTEWANDNLVSCSIGLRPKNPSGVPPKPPCEGDSAPLNPPWPRCGLLRRCALGARGII